VPVPHRLVVAVFMTCAACTIDPALNPRFAIGPADYLRTTA
jgi:hypothetical protein